MSLRLKAHQEPTKRLMVEEPLSSQAGQQMSDYFASCGVLQSVLKVEVALD